MKRIITVIAAAALSFAAFAYNPPVQGENLFYLSHPELLSGGISTAGGGLQYILPATTMINPALAGLEERVSIDLGYTAMINGGSGKSYGQAFGTGILIPTDWVHISGEFEGIFSEIPGLYLSNSLHLKFALAKQVIDRLYVGVGLGGGAVWGSGTDWMLGLDVGALYSLGDLGFLKNFRIAATANNIGKTFNDEVVLGIEGVDADSAFLEGYPSFLTLRTGVAAELVQTEKFRLGLSFDVTTPMFRNLIFDTGVQMSISDFVRITSSWEFNLREFGESCASLIPTLGIAFKFNINTRNGWTSSHDWERSELTPSVAYKNVDGDKHLIGAGAALKLGILDDSGPIIEME